MTTNYFTCRVFNETAVLVASKTLPMRGVHKSKETLFTTLNSFVMPKGNLIKVCRETKTFFIAKLGFFSLP